MANKKILVIAILLGLLTAGGIYTYLQMMKSSFDNTVYVPVVTAKQTIPAKAAVTAEMLEVKRVPQAYRHPGALADLEEAAGAITLEGIVAGEQVLKERIVRERETKGGLAFMVPKDKRAVTVAVDEVKGVGGNLQPGDRVDVMTTVDFEDGQSTLSYGVVTLQDVEVLAVGKVDQALPSQSKDDGKKAADNKTVTLAVSLAQAQPLVLASEKGNIRLMLRNPVDREKVPTSPFEMHDFLNPGRVSATGAP